MSPSSPPFASVTPPRVCCATADTTFPGAPSEFSDCTAVSRFLTNAAGFVVSKPSSVDTPPIKLLNACPDAANAVWALVAVVESSDWYGAATAASNAVNSALAASALTYAPPPAFNEVANSA